ncbi:unnamed protein product [Ixodes hexagonus]
MKNAVILLLATMAPVALAVSATQDTNTTKEGGGGGLDGRGWVAPGHAVYPVVKPVYPVVQPVYPVVQPVYPVVKPVYPAHAFYLSRCTLRLCDVYQCHYKCLRRSDCFGTLGELDGRKGNKKAEINVSRPVNQKVDAFDYVPPKP